MEPEEVELLDDFIGDVSAYCLSDARGEASMEPDIDGEWVRLEDVRANVLRGVRAHGVGGPEE